MGTKVERALSWCAVSSRAQVHDDKWSIDVQRDENSAFVQKRGDRLIETLIVPGHSRRYLSLEALAAAAAKKEMFAFDRLLAHFEARDFDYLIVRDGDRFARTQSLFARITEEIINTGARIYSHADGWIDRANYRMWISMVGYRAAADVDKLVEFRRVGMEQRAARGLPVSARIPISHLLVRNERGKAERLVINEDKRRLFDDLYTLIMEGVGWNNMAGELYQRYGHVDEATGTPYPVSLPYRLLMNPLVWGHLATGHKRPWKVGTWVFDRSAPPPDGVNVYRDVVPAMYTGAVAETIMDEMRRRIMLRGNARPYQTHRYSGLMVCGACGGAMVITHGKKKRHYMYCTAQYKKPLPGVPVCDQRGNISYRYLDAYVDALLRRLLDGETLESIFETETTVDPPNDQRAATELATVQQQIERLIVEQSLSDERTQEHYRAALARLVEREGILSALVQEQAQRARVQDAVERARNDAVEDLRAIGLESFWQMPNVDINRLLHRILGQYQLVALNQKITNLTLRRRRKGNVW